MTSANPDPVRYHRERLAERREDRARLERADLRLSRARLATALLLIALALASLWQGWLSAWWLAAPAALFAGLIVVHNRVIRLLQAASRRVGWHELALARLEAGWVGRGETGARFQDADHPYALDLDILGDGSLFQLLTTGQTAAGEETLARWLLAGADVAPVRQRQAAVRDLASRPLFREELYTLGADVRAAVDSVRLADWATAPAQLDAGWLRMAAAVASGAAVAALAAWLAGLVPGALPAVLILGNVVAGGFFRGAVSRVLHGSAEPARELAVLGAIVGRVRRESFAADRLRQLAGDLGETGDPVRTVRQLGRLIEMHDWQHNILFAPIAACVLWGLQCATAVEAWRARHGQAVTAWLRIAGEIEALASLATYHFGRPDQPFPELAEGDTPVCEGEQLAHPLLPAGAVANDVALGARPQLLVVSGSNMAGKTTLLRTVGVNAVLALAGAPVRARRLRLTPLAIGGTLRVQDSLLDGRSRFYAEITRLRRLVDMARGPAPLLFLLDELFHGTNSSDRLDGAHGVLRYLLELHAIGLITTHDLALAALADRLAPAAANVHFEDQLAAEGAMTFDYRLRPGRSTGTNALALMAAVGLDVSGASAPKGDLLDLDPDAGRPSTAASEALIADRADRL